jgi:hypothetical protein
MLPILVPAVSVIGFDVPPEAFQGGLEATAVIRETADPTGVHLHGMKYVEGSPVIERPGLKYNPVTRSLGRRYSRCPPSNTPSGHRRGRSTISSRVSVSRRGPVLAIPE